MISSIVRASPECAPVEVIRSPYNTKISTIIKSRIIGGRDMVLRLERSVESCRSIRLSVVLQERATESCLMRLACSGVAGAQVLLPAFARMTWKALWSSWMVVGELAISLPVGP